GEVGQAGGLREIVAWVRRRDLHVVVPDRRREVGAVAGQRDARVRGADPDRGRDVGRVADEPGVGLRLGRPGLAGGRAGNVTARRRAVIERALHDVLHHVGDTLGD